MRRIVIVALSLPCLWSIAFAQDNFPDVPESHAELKTLARLGAEGFVARDQFWSGRPASKARMAATVINAVDAVRASLDKMLTSAKEPSKCKMTPERWRLEIPLYASGWRTDFRTAVGLLNPEIKKLGRDPDQLLKQIDSNQKTADQIVEVYKANMIRAGGAPLFPDVPPSHWAWGPCSRCGTQTSCPVTPKVGLRAEVT
ncbi:MAG: hypothetical protein ACHQ50_04995 [Fimbriimonadales bacterium]